MGTFGAHRETCSQGDRPPVRFLRLSNKVNKIVQQSY